MLSRLLYTSNAKLGLGLGELRGILKEAREANEKVEVTGMLCVCQGQFLQALEGRRQVINDLYLKIARDPRHWDCALLDFKAIERRSFDHWSMQLIDLDNNLNAARKKLLLQYASDATNAPFHISADSATALMMKLQVSE